MAHPMATENVRIALDVTPEMDAAIREAAGNRRGRRLSTYIREAIQEKLDKGKREPETELLLDRFKALNPKGREWLLEAARIAATSDEMREIVTRQRGDKDKVAG